MTTAEKIAMKQQLLEQTVASLRHVVRHNGAAISANADIHEIAAHATEINPDRVKTMWTDINTIDKVKHIVKGQFALRIPDMTTEELMTYAVNDPRLTEKNYSWAVLRVTKRGTEIVTYGGDFYQKYTPEYVTEEVTEDVEKEVVDETTGETSVVTETVTYTKKYYADKPFVQEGNKELLKKVLESEPATWMAEVWSADLSGELETYTENDIEYAILPCDIPFNPKQLISMALGGIDSEGLEKVLSKELSDKIVDTSYDGMIGLPFGIWLIYDNKNLNAPEGLMIPVSILEGLPKELVNAGISSIKIIYNAIVSGMRRLRLVGESFGDEYLISTQDLSWNAEGTWKE